MTINEIQTDAGKLETEIINLLNSFEGKYGSDTIQLGQVTRYNGSNNAWGKIIRLNMSVRLEPKKET